MTKPPFALATEVKAGDTLIADACFTCIPNNAELVIKQDEDYRDSDELAGLYVLCHAGKHYLSGQLGGPFGGLRSSEHLVGFWKKETK